MEELTPTQFAWQSQLESVGRQTFSASVAKVSRSLVLTALGISLFLIFMHYAGNFSRNELVLTILICAGPLLGISAWLHWKYRGREMVVDLHGITILNGDQFAWSDISRVGIYGGGRQRPAVVIMLTEPAWNAHIAKQGTLAAWMHKVNSRALSARALLMPTYLDANAPELAVWLDQFAQGTSTE